MDRLSTGCWIAAFVAIPLVYMADVYDGALLPKLLVLQLALLLLVGIYLYRAQAGQCPCHRLFWPMGLYLGLSVLATHAAVNRIESILNLSQYISLMLIAPVVAGTLTPHHLLRVVRIAAWVGLPIASIGLCQYWGIAFQDIPSRANPSATFYHRNAAAEYLIAVLPLAWIGFRLAQTPRSATAWAILLTFLGTFLIYTRTRGAWIGLLVAIAATALLARLSGRVSLSRHFRLKRYLIAGACALIALAALHPGNIQRPGVQHFDEKKSDALSAVASIATTSGHRGRLDLWENTLDIIRDHPITGVAPGNWQYRYPAYAHGEHINVQAAPERPHNDLLWIASETGIPGLVAYLLILVAAGWSCWRVLHRATPETRTLALGFAALIIAHLIDGLFNFPRERIEAASFFWFAIGGLVVLDLRSPAPRHTGWKAILPPALALVLLLCATGITFIRLQYDRHHLRVIAAERQENWPEIIASANAAAQWGPLRANTFIALGRAHLRTDNLQEALNAYQTATRLHPNSLNASNNLGIVHWRLGHMDDAIAAFHHALFIFPDFPEALNNLGNAYCDTGQLDKAVEAYLRAAERSTLPVIVYNLGIAYHLQGDLQRAQQSYLQALHNDPAYYPARHKVHQLGANPASLPPEP